METLDDLLIEAVKGGYTEVVRVLLEDGILDPKFNTRYALRLASFLGHTEIVKLLLEDGRVIINTTFDDYHILWAISFGETESSKLIEEYLRRNHYALSTI